MSTYVPIQAITLSATASSVEFTGIPQTYTDLRLVVNGNLTSLEDIGVRFNGDSGSNYSYTGLTGNGSTASSNRQSNQTYAYVGSLDGSQSMTTYDFMNYANATTNKTFLNRTSAAGWVVYSRVGLWRSTAAVSSISLTPVNQFASGTTFTLYGVGTGSPKAFGGSTVATDGTYWYHAFTASGTFEPLEDLTADILVVAGGGGGNLSSASAGGGGAGGLLALTSQSITKQKHTITIGAGGVGTVSASGSYSAASNGTNGNNSQFGSLTAAVGGGLGGGYSVSGNGSAGGSGGGGGTNSGTGGAATSGQGFAGGTAGSGGAFYSGAGGGAGAVGGNGTSGLAAGGIGATSALITAMGNATLSGVLSSGNRYFAGGGGGSSNGAGGGAGGLGGGGQGATANKLGGASGLANTGGGAGGGSNTEAVAVTGGNGGSGIVIIRYAV